MMAQQQKMPLIHSLSTNLKRLWHALPFQCLSSVEDDNYRMPKKMMQVDYRGWANSLPADVRQNWRARYIEMTGYPTTDLPDAGGNFPEIIPLESIELLEGAFAIRMPAWARTNLISQTAGASPTPLVKSVIFDVIALLVSDLTSQITIDKEALSHALGHGAPFRRRNTGTLFTCRMEIESFFTTIIRTYHVSLKIQSRSLTLTAFSSRFASSNLSIGEKRRLTR
jgi:hypothetical protein